MTTVPVLEIEPVTTIHRVMLCYGKLVSLRLNINTRTANVLNNFSVKYMLKYMSHVMAKLIRVIVLHDNIQDVVSASAYRHSRIRVCVLLWL